MTHLCWYLAWLWPENFLLQTGKLIKFPLQEDEVMMEELAASQFEVINLFLLIIYNNI